METGQIANGAERPRQACEPPSGPDGLAGQGLRDRKKAATSMALHEAAMRLAIAHGLSEVTVEAIADEANVSRRTFSNYFANKEDALLYEDRVRVRRLLDEARSRPADESAWQVLRQVAASRYADWDELDPRWVAQTRLIRQHPSLRAQQMAVHANTERDLAEAISRRTADPMAARLMVAAFLAAQRIAVETWLEGQGARPLAEVMEHALDLVGRRFE
ncbi:TetR/AcrR family transcriptional regulator [Polymorphospora rubra]|uniref:TetR/AcrR family transcriptional regulator n=1 Tax=Polymorphospora rubra TaxID=338584 RepID=UPI001FEC8845|nr:TetR family transcriptional regulator [Polymorphospora rubra]